MSFDPNSTASLCRQILGEIDPKKPDFVLPTQTIQLILETLIETAHRLNIATAPKGFEAQKAGDHLIRATMDATEKMLEINAKETVKPSLGRFQFSGPK